MWRNSVVHLAITFLETTPSTYISYPQSKIRVFYERMDIFILLYHTMGKDKAGWRGGRVVYNMIAGWWVIGVCYVQSYDTVIACGFCEKMIGDVDVYFWKARAMTALIIMGRLLGSRGGGFRFVGRKCIFCRPGDGQQKKIRF